MEIILTLAERGKNSTFSSKTHAPMTVNDYAMDLDLMPVTISRPTVSLCTLSPSQQGSSIPSTYSEAVNPSKSFVPKPEIRTYFGKPNKIFELVVEPEFDGSSIIEIIQKIYPQGFYFLPESLIKTRKFYEFILVDTKSVEITHFPHKSDPSKIAYSKLKIFKVMNPTHWNQDIHTEKTLSRPFNPQTFSYRDYMVAWYNVMWCQNYEHSWFIKFSKNAHQINYPFWFIPWWKTFGLTKKIFPVPIQESFFYFSQTILKNAFPTTMRFCLYFQIPWIFCWDFKSTSYPYYKQIIKILKIKWWRKYNFSHATIKEVKQWFAENDNLQDLSKKKNFEFLNLKSKLLAALAQTTCEADFQKILQQVASVASSSFHYNSDEEVEYDVNDPFLDSQSMWV